MKEKYIYIKREKLNLNNIILNFNDFYKRDDKDNKDDNIYQLIDLFYDDNIEKILAKVKINENNEIIIDNIISHFLYSINYFKY